jgi:hypothetical protein
MHWFASKQSKSKQASVEHERTASKEGLEKDGQAIRGPSQGPGLTPTPHIKGPTVCEQLSPSDIALQKYFDDYNMAHLGYYPNVYEKESFVAGYNAKKPTVTAQSFNQWDGHCNTCGGVSGSMLEVFMTSVQGWFFCPYCGKKLKSGKP